YPRFIETYYGEGYRYVGPLELALPSGEPPAEQIETMRAVRIVIEEELQGGNGELGESGAGLRIPNRAVESATTLARPRHSVRVAVMLSGLVLIAIAAAAIVYFNRAAPLDSPSSSAQSIAVLPLRDLSPDAGSDYLSEGITESLISAVSRVESLRVVSRGSVRSFKGKDVDPRQVGAELGVATVLEGSLQRSGDRMRVQVRLVSAQDGHVLWSSDTYDRAPGDIFAIQDDIARGVTSALRLKPVRDQERRLAR